MGDIRIKLKEDSIELWRTAMIQKGKHLRVQGSHVVVKDKSEIVSDLATFRPVAHGKQV